MSVAQDIEHQQSSSLTQNSQNSSHGNSGEFYRYFPVPGPRHIRLLRLLPHRDKNAPLHCQLFDYPMRELEEGPHMYEALSYVWGSSEKPRTLFISGNAMPVTANLHEVLLRLRDQMIERILWIDAICIDQDSIKERGEQIQHMAEIYCKANRVIVWLGEAADNSDLALKNIRMAADAESQQPSNNNTDQQAIFDILERPWFRRIWVLQEVAAAQHVVIMCGSMRIDGYAFCLGLPSLLPYEETPNHIRSVTYLMKGSIFRPKYSLNTSGDVSLDIRPLGELMDMYHTHEATERHDKVFALLGMSSDNPSTAGLSPNYKISWEELMAQVVRFILGEQVFVKAWVNQQAAVVFAKGYAVGIVTSVQTTEDTYRSDKQLVSIKIGDAAGPSWTVQATAKPIEVGDIFCHLLGAAKPMIIRPCEDYFSIIIIEFNSPQDDRMNSTGFGQPEQPGGASVHDFLLVWDWDVPHGKMADEEYETWLNNRAAEYPNDESAGSPDKQTRLWNAAMIMSDAGSNKKAVIKTLQEIKDTYARDFGEADRRTLTCMSKLALTYGRTGHFWEAENEFWWMIWAKKNTPEGGPDIIRDFTSFEAMWKSQGQFHKAKPLGKTADLLKAIGTCPEVIETIRSIDEDLAELLIEGSLKRSRKRAPTIVEDRISRMREINQPIGQKSFNIRNMEGLLLEAIRRESVEATYLLLCQQEISVTEEMLIEAIENEDNSVFWCLFGREKDGIQITEKAVVAAARKSNESVLQYLLERKGSKVRITENVVLAAVRNRERSVLTYLLERWGSRISVTQKVAISAAKHEEFPALKLLLQKKGSEIELTEDVIVAAAKNREKSVLHTLLQERGSEIQLTALAITAARKNENSLALRYILDRGKEIIRSKKE